MDPWLNNIYAAVIIISVVIAVFELFHKHDSHKKVHKHLKKHKSQQ